MQHGPWQVLVIIFGMRVVGFRYLHTIKKASWPGGGGGPVKSRYYATVGKQEVNSTRT